MGITLSVLNYVYIDNCSRLILTWLIARMHKFSWSANINIVAMETEIFLPAARLKKRKREKEKKIWFYAHISACKYLGYTGKALGCTRPNIS